jgi:hypothetical protein
MSYGIKTFDAAGRVQIDTTRAEDTGLIVVDSGTASSISNVTDEDLIFVNLQPSSGNIGFVAKSLSGTTMSFFGTATSEEGNFEGDSVSVNYIVARKGSSISYSGTGYGFQCFNEDGGTIYDTRGFNGNGGFAIAGYSEPQQHTGDLFATTQYGGPANGLITSTTTDYVSVENTFVGTIGTNTGNKVKGRYIVFANNFSANYTSVESKGYREGSTTSTYFSGTMTGIYFYRMRAGPQSSHIAHPNPSTIPYGGTT